ncbi:Uncharacterised protein [uncultured archaeon]|nr:Uncharacterised protein [uncultured archaeon]
MEERVYQIDKKDKKQLDELLALDPYAPVSFGRISPVLREMDERLFMYIKSDDAGVWKFVDEKLKAVPSAKHAAKPDEDKIVKMIHDEEEAAAGGFGNIFG